MDFPGPFFSALWQPAAGRAPGPGAFAGPALILATGRPDRTRPAARPWKPDVGGCQRHPLEARRRHELRHVIRVTPYQLPVIDRAYPGAQEHPARSLNF